jgi:flagellar hook-associated protein 2
MSGTNVVSGLASGLDWRDILDQLRAVEYKRVELIQDRRKTYTDRLSTWQSINTKLLAFKTAAGTLNRTAGFNIYTTSLASNTSTAAEDILSVTTTPDAAPGAYQIKVNSLATSQKLTSNSYASQSTALGLSGDLVIGGRKVTISATDSLTGIRDKINAVNSGTGPSKVSASVVNYGTSGYRLVLSSDEEGAAGISLLNGGATNLVGALGFVDATASTVKNPLTGADRSDVFSAANLAIGGASLLNLTSPQNGNVTITIDGTTRNNININLATDSLNTIRDTINTRFGATRASVISETDDSGNTSYRLLIEGSTITYTDTNNILETLGVLERQGVSDERGMTADVANTSLGVAITSSTLIRDIDGFTGYNPADYIRLDGTSTSGGNVNNRRLNLNNNTTVGDLLNEIQTAFGDVTARLTADGKIQVVDNEIGDTQLVVQISTSDTTLSFDADNNLGAISSLRQRQIQAGANANITVDGVTITPSSNTVDDVITGVTLNLKQASAATTVTLTVSRDYEGIKEAISGFVTAYNEVMAAINAQLTYNSDTSTPGGPLFGDSTLKNIKNNLTDLIINRVSGVDQDFSTLGIVGIKLGNDSTLSIDDDELQENLENNFNDVRRLFAADWSATNSNLSYGYHTTDTKAGTYTINITGTNPVAGYFVTPGDARGSGEYLTGISGNAKGLMIRYSGTATGNVGTFTLTYGVAELMDRALYSVTDSVNGTISNKTETIQDQVDNIDESIQRLEERIEQKLARMEQQFIAMEMALSTMQSQSNWLSSQISSSMSGWR